MRHKVLPALGVAATLLGLYLLIRIFRKHDFAVILEIAESAPTGDLLLAGMFTAASYACIATIELVGIVYVHHAVRVRRIIATALGAIGIGRAIGLAALSSGAIRYRMYGRAGLDLAATGKVVMFAGLTLMAGLGTVGGTALIWQANTLAPLVGVSAVTLTLAGLGALAFVALYLLLCTFSPRRIIPVWRGESIRIPPARFALAQLVLGSANILCIGGALYASLRSFNRVEYATAVALYVSSDITALVTHVPGGWGVLEVIVTSVLDGSRVLAGIVLYRAIYYLVPLGIGLVVFVIDELAGRRRMLRARHAERMREAALGG